jgi:hypothetical protein
VADEADDDRPPGRLFRKVFGIVDEPPDETPTQRIDRARVWLVSESPAHRRQALSTLAADEPEDAIEPCFKALLADPDESVRSMAFMLLLGYDTPAPSRHGDRIVRELGGESSAAAWFVQNHRGAGSIGSFGLTDRLLPCLDAIARNGRRRKDRRVAARYARELRTHPRGWPLTDSASLGTPPRES